jgi:hypothetical protein
LACPLARPLPGVRSRHEADGRQPFGLVYEGAGAARIPKATAFIEGLLVVIMKNERPPARWAGSILLRADGVSE